MPSSAPPTPATPTLSLHDALPISPGQSGLERLEDFLHDRTVLVVLDNFEHLMPAAPTVARILEASPGLTVIATSRAPLHIAAEQERSEEHTSELQSPCNLVCRLLLPPPPPPPLFPYTTLFRSPPASPGSSGSRTFSTIGPCSSCSTTSSTSCRPRPPSRASSRPRPASRSLQPAARRSTSPPSRRDRKSTRLNSSHLVISYAVFCSPHPRHPHSFPTRRSSDLPRPVRARAARGLSPRSDRARRARQLRAPHAGRAHRRAHPRGLARPHGHCNQPRAAPHRRRAGEIGRAHV